ncbi:MAG TPA: histidine kinase [Actinomycetota bacterium]|nr:histidine kinase [Actinomycetota bacterium]
MLQEHAHLADVQRGRHLLLARVLAGLTLAGFAIGIVFAFLDASIRPPGTGDSLGDIVFVLSFAMFPVIGYLLASRRPENSIGWLMLGIGTYFGLGAIVSELGAYLVHSGRPDAGFVLIAFDQPSWLPIVVLPVTFLLLLFPDGHLPSPRWRWFAWALGIGLILVFFSILLDPAPMQESPVADVRNPIGIEALGPILHAAQALILVIPIGVIASLTALVLRFRRSRGVERLQLRWLLTAAAFVGLLYTGAILASLGGSWDGENDPGWLIVVQTVVLVSFALIPIAIGVSILRYRLFDIDVVINRAVLFGALAVFITVVYVAIVVGVGALVGSQASPVLSAAAAATVALAFQPLRRRAQRLADRLVYGKRATPYEVLSEFSERVGQTYANEELLPRMARALGEGTGAARADVWVRVGEELRSEATWPEDAEVPPPRAMSSSEERVATASSFFEPVRHRDELLGALSIEKRPGESLSATEEKLIQDLAAQAGLVMRNAALTEDLLDTIEQLRTSRQRLVTAQDEERRKLERNLHDGAQQQLVALTVKLGLLERLVERDPGQAKTIAGQLQGDATGALEELRDLARGIYPPLLADQGLAAALGSQARKSTVPVTIEAEGVGRYAREAEAAVYFSCLEALQNVAKYASASRATVRLSDGDGRLRFEVTDDGAGFDPSTSSYGTGLQGIADRLAALDGELEVRSSVGAGTTVAGTLPVGNGRVVDDAQSEVPLPASKSLGG